MTKSIKLVGKMGWTCKTFVIQEVSLCAILTEENSDVIKEYFVQI